MVSVSCWFASVSSVSSDDSLIHAREGSFTHKPDRSRSKREIPVADLAIKNRYDQVWWKAACPVSGGGSDITDIPFVSIDTANF